MTEQATEQAVEAFIARWGSGISRGGNERANLQMFVTELCIFTMFAEDVGFLPERSFTELLERLQTKPDSFCRQLHSLWRTMNAGGFAPALDTEVPRFNGGLFADAQVIALTAFRREISVRPRVNRAAFAEGSRPH